LEVVPHPTPQFGAKPGEGYRDLRGDMLAVQLVYLVAAYESRADDSLFDEAGQAAADADLRAASGDARHVSDRQGPAGDREDREHRTVESWCYRAGGIREIHI